MDSVFSIVSRNTEKNISYLSQKGVHRLLCQSRKLQAIELATALGIQHVIKLIPDELTFVQIIQSCFQGETIMLQHRVGISQLVVWNPLFLDPSDGVFGRFDLAALCGCHTLNVCLFV